jgi:ankyrin repeat protein
MTRLPAALAVLVLCCLDAAAAQPERDVELVRAARAADLAAASRLLQQGASPGAVLTMQAAPGHGSLAEDGPGDAGWRLGETALAAAARSGSLEIARLLVAAGADPNRAGASRAMPLSLAAARGDLALADLLLAAGARTDVRDPAGSLPLSRAVTMGDAALARRLLEAGADPDGRERDGSTPLAEAVRLGRMDLVRLLIGAGARVDAADREGKSPLYRAIVLRRESIALLLLDHGADPRRRIEGEDLSHHARWAQLNKVLERIEDALR